MSRATFQQIVAGVQRQPGLEKLSLGRIMDAVATAEKDLQNRPWPWNYAESNVLVPAPITEGTVSITNGTATVNHTGLAWPLTLGNGWRFRFGNSNLDYIITTNTAFTATLAQPVNLAASLVNTTYTLYQDTYPYPTDYLVGSDVALLQPTIRNRISKIPRYKFEMVMNEGLRSFSTNIQMFYCDQAQATDSLGNKFYQFRLGPPPAGPAELRLCYHTKADDLTSFSVETDMPDGWDEIVTLMAAAKLYKLNSLPGMGDGAEAIAAGKMRTLTKQMANQTIDDVPNPSMEVPDSSISQYGMMIGRTP